MKNAHSTSLYAEAQVTGATIAALVVHRSAASIPAQREPVRRVPIRLASVRSANQVASTHKRYGSACNPNSEENTRKNTRSLKTRTVPCARGANNTCHKSLA